MIKLVLSVIGSLLIIARFLGGNKRRSRSLLKRIKKIEELLAKALVNNDTIGMSKYSYELRELRKEHAILNG